MKCFWLCEHSLHLCVKARLDSGAHISLKQQECKHDYNLGSHKIQDDFALIRTAKSQHSTGLNKTASLEDEDNKLTF